MNNKDIEKIKKQDEEIKKKSYNYYKIKIMAKKLIYY